MALPSTQFDNWDGASHMDGMSQTKSRSGSAGTQRGEDSPDALPFGSFELVGRTLDAILHDYSAAMKAVLVSRYLADSVRTEFRHLSGRPVWLREVLKANGDAVLLRLLEANWECLLSASAVREEFGIAPSTLHREKDAGCIIAYSPPGVREYVFPREQFLQKEVHSWAGKLIDAVGNGAPALHFLYVGRASLGGKSLAQTLRVRTEGTSDIPLLAAIGSIERE